MKLVISLRGRGITRRYENVKSGLRSAFWGSLVHQQMDKPPDARNPFFRDLVPSMLVCTIFTQMKPFVIEMLLGLAPVWKSRCALRVVEIARFPHRT